MRSPLRAPRADGYAELVRRGKVPSLAPCVVSIHLVSRALGYIVGASTRSLSHYHHHVSSSSIVVRFALCVGTRVLNSAARAARATTCAAKGGANATLANRVRLYDLAMTRAWFCPLLERTMANYHGPWTLAMHNDEVSPSSPLKRGTDARNAEAVYWSFLEFVPARLSNDRRWLMLNAIRSGAARSAAYCMTGMLRVWLRRLSLTMCFDLFIALILPRSRQDCA